MSEPHIRILKVGEDEGIRARKGAVQHLCVFGIVLSAPDGLESATVEELWDDADAKGGPKGSRHGVDQVEWRVKRKVLAPIGTEKGTRRPGEGAGDHALDAVRSGAKFARNAAHRVQALYRHNVFVASDLEDTVRARIEDGLAGRHVLRPEFLNDCRSAGGPVAKDANANALLKSLHKVGRKSAGVSRKRAGDQDAHHFPVAGHGVLAPFGERLEPSIFGIKSGVWLPWHQGNLSCSQEPNVKKVRSVDASSGLADVK